MSCYLLIQAAVTADATMKRASNEYVKGTFKNMSFFCRETSVIESLIFTPRVVMHHSPF